MKAMHGVASANQNKPRDETASTTRRVAVKTSQPFCRRLVLHCSPLEESFLGLQWDFLLQYLNWPLKIVHFVIPVMHPEVSLAIISSEKAAVVRAATFTQRTSN